MHLFYVTGIRTGEETLLPADEAVHALRVLRLKKNDTIHITDGTGNLFEAIITGDNIRRCTVQAVRRQEAYGKRNHFLHIAIAPVKNLTRFEWFLEKATEIGVDEISPICCEHSERKEINRDRLAKVIVSAMKQSVKAYLPRLNPVSSLKDLFVQKFAGKKFIAHIPPSPEYQDTVSLSKTYPPGENCLICIGPEGGFSEKEIQSARGNGFIPVSLGTSRLRTETAGIVACHTINLLNETQ